MVSLFVGYFLTDEHSLGGPADSASSHLISSQPVQLSRFVVCACVCGLGFIVFLASLVTLARGLDVGSTQT